MSQPNAEYELLLRKRFIIEARYKSFQTFLSNIPSEVTIQQVIAFEDRLHNFSALFKEFSDIQTEIECRADPDNLAEQVAIRVAFENAYYETTSKAKTVLKPLTEHSAALSTPIRETIEIPPPIKLPTLQIPKFSGLYDQWLTFFDSFNNLIHNNAKLSNIEKFRYLRDALQGEAAQVIASFETTESNYTDAWVLVQKRFENKNIRVHNHIKGMVEFPAIGKESFSELRKLLDAIQSHIRALKTLGQPVEQWDSLLIYLISEKFDPATKREWEIEAIKGNNLPTMKGMIAFIELRCQVLEKVNKTVKTPTTSSQKPSTTNINKSSKKIDNKPVVSSHAATADSTSTPESQNCCPLCQQSHNIFNCKRFLDFSIRDRITEVKRLRLCLNCLRSGHISQNCKSSSCRKCSKKHNTLLHIENPVSPENSNNNATSNTGSFVSNINQLPAKFIQQLLATARVHIIDKSGNPREVTALLDAGSQANFMTELLCNELGLNKSQITLPILGIGGSHSKSLSVVSAKVKSRVSDFERTLSFSLLPSITQDLPQTSFDISSIKIPDGVELADPQFNKKKPIGLLLGVDIFWEILCNNTLQHDYLHNTLFGYVVSGRIPIQRPSRSKTCNLSTSELAHQLTRFWEVESIPTVKHLTPEEKACEDHFQSTHKRNEDGRFIVDIPLHTSPEVLGNSFDQAMKRFYSLERKFQSNADLRAKYVDFVNEFEALQHMSKLDQSEISQPLHYLPHHGVIKTDSLTTKLRVVFDGSAFTDTGVSFNDIQLVGPTIQADLFSIILRFRKFKFVVTSDIAKMYRQVLINPLQRYLQCILWRETPDQPVDSYTLNTVTYGTSSAPFQAIRCLFQLAQECEQYHPEIAKIIRTSMYVDDLLCGADSRDELIQICHDISAIMMQGRFELRKWASNDTEVLQRVPNSIIDCNVIDIGSDNQHKTLGLHWHTQHDAFVYQIQTSDIDNFTKRSILSIIARIFDPLGFLSPVVIRAKIILQRCWQAHTDWDEQLPHDIQQEFKSLYSELQSINEIHVPRHVYLVNYANLELHSFSDASTVAYGCAIYVRCQGQEGEVSVKLLCAKCKVAPIKTVSIPRLELLAAHMMMNLAEKVNDALEINCQHRFYWTDSTIVLSWIRTPPNQLETFVANRVAHIQTLSQSTQWHYVPSIENPADILTRGTRPKKLPTCALWWEGPSFLKQCESEWPAFPHPRSNEIVAQQAQAVIATTNNSQEVFQLFTDFEISHHEKLVAWILRFFKNCQNKVKGIALVSGPLLYSEIKLASRHLTRIAQAECFAEEIKALTEGKAIPKRSSLMSLKPFLHVDGTMRVGGRLRHSNFDFDKKHPIILPANHIFTHELVKREHLRLLHCGPQQLLYHIRQTYWPIHGHKIAKQVTKSCIMCVRANPKLEQPIMGDLPECRITPSRPFERVGVDYAGPFLIQDRGGRGSRQIKTYISLFVCLVTRAIHLELVTELSTEGFIMALRRFASRRGKPSNMMSDNGKNFVGAHNKLNDLGTFLQANEEKLQTELTKERFHWTFIPAYSPHFGGIWEAGVKSVKYHLKRVPSHKFTFERFYTLLTQIEAIVNSRPLSPLSQNPSDFEPLTTGHFLIGAPVTAIPDEDLTDVPEGRLNHYQQIQQEQQRFWRRWSLEYISQLQEGTKWKENSTNIQVGDLVIVKDDNQPSMKWVTGRVVELHPGADGIPRVVTVKTSKGLIKRATARLCVLPQA